MCKSCYQIEYRAAHTRASQEDFKPFGPRVLTTLVARPRSVQENLSTAERNALADLMRMVCR